MYTTLRLKNKKNKQLTHKYPTKKCYIIYTINVIYNLTEDKW